MLNRVEDSLSEVGWEWPQYRCMIDERHFYRIRSPKAFVELQQIGRRWVRHDVEAKVYPEQLRIADMLRASGETYRVCSVEEWQAIEDRMG